MGTHQERKAEDVGRWKSRVRGSAAASLAFSFRWGPVAALAPPGWRGHPKGREARWPRPCGPGRRWPARSARGPAALDRLRCRCGTQGPAPRKSHTRKGKGEGAAVASQGGACARQEHPQHERNTTPKANPCRHTQPCSRPQTGGRPANPETGFQESGTGSTGLPLCNAEWTNGGRYASGPLDSGWQGQGMRRVAAGWARAGLKGGAACAAPVPGPVPAPWKC